MSCFTEKKGCKGGVILVMVLGLIMMMSWLTIEILAAVKKELPRKPDLAQEAQLRNLAYQLLEISIGVLAEIDRIEQGIYSPVQGWGNPLAYAGIREGSEPFRREVGISAFAGEAGSGREPVAGGNGELSLLEELAREETVPEGGGLAEDRFFLLDETDDPAGSLPEGFAEMAVLELPPGLQGRVRIMDESGKLSLTGTSEERWKHFFEAMGFEESERDILTDSLLDWIDRDDVARPHGAETEFYQQRDPPYRAPNRPLRDWQELRLIQGFESLFFDEEGIPNENFQLFRQSVSLHHRGEVNFNTAPALVLEALGEEQGFEAADVSAFLAGADGTFGTSDDRILRRGLNVDTLPRNEDGEPVPFDRTASTLRVVIEVTGGQRIFTLEAILDLSRRHLGGVYPYRIVQLFENTPVH
jgi:hypothetical protein